ncbi:MAG: carboxylesterase family protein [Lachnospiraceae bacterium]|nr:carboxylesterase family protein [Lachnospiraceae bacterium]
MVAFISALGYGFGETISKLSGWPDFACGIASFALGFAVNLLVRGYRVWKIRRLYGDGSGGYVFKLKDKEITKANQRNQPILGEYDASLAVKTRTGVYVGEKHKKTISYLGIPYAKPPVGGLRWKAPEPLPPSEVVRAYIEAQTASSSELEAKSKLVGQWIMLGIYRIAAMLSQSGNRVHLMYWDEKALIENLGSGTADVLATLLGNGDALQMYGSVLNKDLSEALQSLLQKFINQKALQLYSNEIKGVDAFLWKPFPQSLIVSDGEIRCDTIEDKITEVKELLEYQKGFDILEHPIESAGNNW